MKYNLHFIAIIFIVVGALTAYAVNTNFTLKYLNTSTLKNGFSSRLAPTATITGTAEVCQNTSPLPQITFTGANGSTPYTFTYTINNGSEETIQTNVNNNSVSINALTNTVGIFTYRLTGVEDGSNDSSDATGSAVITVGSPPTVDFTINNQNICSGTSITFTPNVSGSGPFQYEWNFGDGTTSTQTSPTKSYNAVGCGVSNFTARLTVTDNNGCIEETSQAISVSRRPDIAFTDSDALFSDPFDNCNNNANDAAYTINVGNVSASTCIDTFNINWGDGTSANNVSFPLSHTYLQLGSFNMTITGIGSNGCSSIVTYLVKNSSNPIGAIEIPGNTVNLCLPVNPINFAIGSWGTNPPDTFYTVNYGDGTIISLTQQELEDSTFYNSANPQASQNFPIPHVYTETNCPNSSYTVILTINTSCGESVLTAGPIVILKKPEVDFNVVPLACSNTNIQFENNSTNGFNQNCNTITNYLWDFGDGNTSTAINPIHSYSNPGIYTVSLTGTSFCGTTEPVTKEICIEDPLEPSFNFVNNDFCSPYQSAINNTTDISGGCSENIYLWEVVYSQDFCGTGTGIWSYTNGTNQNSFEPEFIFETPGIYTIMLTTTNSCGSTSTQTDINVTQPPIVSLNTVDDACGPVNVAAVANVQQCIPINSNVVYSWSFPGGNPETSNQLEPGIIEYNLPGNYEISLTVTNECGTESAVTNFIVYDLPTLTNTDNQQEICSDNTTNEIILTSNLDETVYTWTSNNPVGLSGFINSGNSNIIPSQILVNDTDNPIILTYTVTPSASGCNGTPFDFTIIVNPAPLIDNHPLSDTVCIDGTTNDLVVSYVNGTGTPSYQWYENADNNTTTGTPISGATGSTFSPPTNVVGITYYYVIITFDSGGCSEIISNTAVIEVTPSPEITSQPITNQSICVGGELDSLTSAITGGVGNITYQWYSNTVDSNTGGTLIAGATNASYTPPTFNTVGNFYFYVVISVDGNGCGEITSDTAQVTVVNDPAIATQAIATQELCQNAVPTDLEVQVTGGLGNITYQWFINTAASNSGGTAVSGATSNNYTPPTTTIGTFYYYVVVTQDVSGCETMSAVSELVILAAPLIDNQPISDTVCIDGATNDLVVSYVNGTGTPSYQWYENTENNTTTGSAINGATGSTFSPPTNVVGITYYYLIITFDSGGCSEIISNTAAIEVTPAPEIITQPIEGQSICVGGNAEILNTAITGGVGNISHQWYSNTNNSNTGGTLIAGATNASYTPPTFNTVGNFYFYVVIAVDGNGCGEITSETAQVTVVNDPEIATQPIATQELCQNAVPTDLEVQVTGGLGNITYQWFINSVASNSGGTAVSGATSNNYTPPTTTIGTFYYYALVTQDVSGCETVSEVSELVILPAPLIDDQPISYTVCIDGSTNDLTVSYSNGTGTPSYQWYENAENNTTSGTLISGATGSTFSPPTGTVGVTYYYVIITFDSGGCSEIISNTAVIEVTPSPEITTQPIDSQSICVGGEVNSLTSTITGGVGNITYQWYSNTVDSNTGGTLIAGATNASYTPPTFNTVGNFYFYVVISVDGNGCGEITSETAQVTVVNDPEIATQAIATQELCQNAVPTDLEVQVTGGLGNITYQWFINTAASNSGGTAVSGATSNNYTPPTTTIGTFYYYVVVTQDVSGCETMSDVSELVILAAPLTDNQPISDTVCIDGATNDLVVSYVNGTGTPSYQWYENADNNTTTGTPISGATGSTFSPPTDTVGITYYYVIITFDSGGCSEIISNTAVIEVTPSPEITSQPITNQSICVGGELDSLTSTITGGVGNITYQWYSNTVDSNTGGTLIAGATNASYTPPTFNTVGNFYFYVVISVDGNGCGEITSDTAQVTVVNDPEIATQPIATQELCQNAVPTDLEVQVTGGLGNITYQWFINTAASNSGGTAVSGATSNNYTPPTTTIGTFYYYVVVTQDVSGCETMSAVSELVILAAPLIDNQPISDTVCIDGATNDLVVSYVNGTGTPSYQWYENADNNTTTGTPISGATGSTFSPPTDTVGIIYYYVIITFDSGGCSDIISNTAEITVNQTPQIENIELSICSGNNFQLNLDDNPNNIIPVGTIYTWLNPEIIPAGSISGANSQLTPVLDISQSLINNTQSVATVIYTITPVSGDCVGMPFLVNVTVNPAISVEATQQNNSCFESNNASININISGGIPFNSGNPYSVNWIGPNGFVSNDQNISNLEVGDYTLIIDDNGGCTYSETFTITEPELLEFESIFFDPNSITCFGANDGNIDIVVIGGTEPYAYSWTRNGQPFSSNANIDNLEPGDYEITVTDANNCGPIIQTFTLVEPPLLTLTLASLNEVLCFGDATGAVNVTAAGGRPDYTFSWIGPNGFSSTNQNISNLEAGSYTVTVTDTSGCEEELVVNLTQNEPITIDVTATEIACFGDNDAIITINNISGGVAPYNIAWSNFGTGMVQTNLAPGTYVITITDAVDCSLVFPVVIESPPLFDINPIVTQISCAGENDASILLNFEGGIAPITVDWSDDPSAGLDRFNLEPGTYSVIISDAQPCDIEASFTIFEVLPLQASAQVTDALECDEPSSGAINLLIQGGTPPYQVVWSNGAITEDLLNIPPNNYTAQITDSNGCNLQQSWEVVRFEPLILTVDTQSEVDCDTKTIEQTFIAQASGGQPPFIYNWSSGSVSGVNNQQMTTDLNGLVVVEAVDGLGCSTTVNLNVSIPVLGNPDFELSSFAFLNLGIFSIQDPIQFTNTATGDYISVLWNFGDGSFSSEENPTHTYFQIGNYVVTQTVTYPFGCVYTKVVTLIIEQGYKLEIPDAFTPNGDGLNDFFAPIHRGLQNLELNIYDTWGSLIYSESGDSIQGWDGNLRNGEAENGNYQYTFSAKTFYGDTINKSGAFVIIK